MTPPTIYIVLLLFLGVLTEVSFGGSTRRLSAAFGAEDELGATLDGVGTTLGGTDEDDGAGGAEEAVGLTGGGEARLNLHLVQMFKKSGSDVWQFGQVFMNSNPSLS
jgi:hypothetical protein